MNSGARTRPGDSDNAADDRSSDAGPSGESRGESALEFSGAADHTPTTPGDMRLCEVILGGETFVVVSMPACDAITAQRLTPGERDIAVRILLGYTNQEIADARGSRPSTVSNQVYSIFDKLGVESRPQLADRMVPRTVRR